MLYLDPKLLLLLIAKLIKKGFVFSLIEINTKESIQNHLLFWLAVLVPLFFFFLLGIPVWIDLNWGLNTVFYSDFYDASKLPLGFLATAIPLSLVVIRMHSSKQAAEQLDRNVTRDSFKNFLEFRHYIISQLNTYQEQKNCLVTFNSEHIFNKVFSHIKPEKFDFSNLNELPSENYLHEIRIWSIKNAVCLKRRLEKSKTKHEKSNIIWEHQRSVKNNLSHWRISIREDIKVKYYFDADEKLETKKDEDQVQIFLFKEDQDDQGNFYLEEVRLNIDDMLKKLAKTCGVTLNELSTDEKEKKNEIREFNYTEYNEIFTTLITNFQILYEY